MRPWCRWARPPGGGVWTGPLLRSPAYPGALGLDGFDVQAVLHGLAGAAGLGTLLGAPARLGAGLAVPVLPEQGGAEVHVVALLLGDVSIWAVDRFHVLPEGAGVCVPLGAAWDLADVGFLEEKRRYGWDRKADSAWEHRPSSRSRVLRQSRAGGTVGRRWVHGWSHVSPAPQESRPQESRPAGAPPRRLRLPPFPAGKPVVKGAPPRTGDMDQSL